MKNYEENHRGTFDLSEDRRSAEWVARNERPALLPAATDACTDIDDGAPEPAAEPDAAPEPPAAAADPVAEDQQVNSEAAATRLVNAERPSRRRPAQLYSPIRTIDTILTLSLQSFAPTT